MFSNKNIDDSVLELRRQFALSSSDIRFLVSDFERADTNRDGLLSYSEFCYALRVYVLYLISIVF